MEASSYIRLIDCAAGRIPADRVLKNGKIVHVLTGEIASGDVAVIDGHIAGIGKYEGKETVNLEGRYISPGFIEGHVHIESSMLTPAQFAAAVMPHGTTTVICDPHEIANVCGKTGINYILKENSPLSIYAMAPSCVPATHMETSGAVLSTKDIAEILDHPRVIGLAEMMNFPGTVAALPEVVDKILLARNRGVLIDGHAPGLSGKDLQAYIAAGISSDHECTTLAEALEKLRAGMAVFIREGSTARNLEALLPLLNSPAAHQCLLVTDDRHADDLLEQGHLDYILRRAVQLGANAITALQMVTINPARHFGFQRLGAITPGFRADLVVLDDLEQFKVRQVYSQGQRIAENGTMVTPIPEQSLNTLDPAIRSSVRINPESIDLTIPAGPGLIRVICCTDGQIVTGQSFLEPKIQDGLLVSDVDRDILKIAVMERHHGNHAIGLGFVQGLGLRKGAIGSSVAHDSHNMIVVGTCDAAMMQAITEITMMNGGLAVTGDDQVYAALPLPVAGLMSTATAEEVRLRLRELRRALDRVGTLVENPLMLLSFLALPVIPELKITDKGLVNVGKFSIVSLQDDRKIIKNE
ncbi:MAG: adenine deaminase [Thermodesulfobacteriota bacterium]|nr:adenine deaminase [Thermodesulfobacteriota bacterium]